MPGLKFWSAVLRPVLIAGQCTSASVYLDMWFNFYGKKKCAWQQARLTSNYTAYKTARRVFRAAIRQHRRNMEHLLTFSRNRRAFFNYVSKRLDVVTQISAYVFDDVVSDGAAADAFQQYFVTNFSSLREEPLPDCVGIPNTSELLFNCTEKEVADVLRSCPNTAISSDGISFRLLKAVCYCIVKPMCILFQQSLNAGVFSQAWKQAVVLPLYKG